MSESSAVPKEKVATSHEMEVDGKPVTLSHSVLKTAAIPAVENPVTITDN